MSPVPCRFDVHAAVFHTRFRRIPSTMVKFVKQSKAATKSYLEERRPGLHDANEHCCRACQCARFVVCERCGGLTQVTGKLIQACGGDVACSNDFLPFPTEIDERVKFISGMLEAYAAGRSIREKNVGGVYFDVVSQMEVQEVIVWLLSGEIDVRRGQFIKHTLNRPVGRAIHVQKPELLPQHLCDLIWDDYHFTNALMVMQLMRLHNVTPSVDEFGVFPLAICVAGFVANCYLLGRLRQREFLVWVHLFVARFSRVPFDKEANFRLDVAIVKEMYDVPCGYSNDNTFEMKRCLPLSHRKRNYILVGPLLYD